MDFRKKLSFYTYRVILLNDLSHTGDPCVADGGGLSSYFDIGSYEQDRSDVINNHHNIIILL